MANDAAQGLLHEFPQRLTISIATDLIIGRQAERIFDGVIMTHSSGDR